MLMVQCNAFSLDVFNFDGPSTDAFSCNGQDNQMWSWNTTDSTLRSEHGGRCLNVQAELEVWAGPLADGSQAVVLFNRGNTKRETITVKWTEIGFSADQPAVVRDLWARKDLGTFTGRYTSPKINHHLVMMLKISVA